MNCIGTKNYVEYFTLYSVDVIKNIKLSQENFEIVMKKFKKKTTSIKINH